MTIPPLWRPFWLRNLTHGLSNGQVRVVRVRFTFLMIKLVTDFFVTAGAAFTAAIIEARGAWPTSPALFVCLVGGCVVAAKNLGDALSAALPPPVIGTPPSSLGGPPAS